MVYKVLKNNIFFLLPYAITLLVIAPFLLLYSKSDIHLWLNQFHSAFFDGFFRMITFLGNGTFLMIPGILLLFYSLRSTLYLAMAYFSTGLIAQLLKRFVFEDCVRPVKYFHNLNTLHLVEGVPLLGGHSFPSGHATSAFAMFLCLAVIGRNHTIQLLCFITACAVAYSRVYLSQHFLGDIFAGSLIGTLGALACYLIFYRKDLKWHNWSLKILFQHEKI
jgi:membrane-associated phospholipid phosphatase